MTEQVWLKTFGDNLQSYMTEYGYTQADLADAIGVSIMTISNYVNAKRMPCIRSLINISYELNVDVSDLIDFGCRIY